ncbi:MULTISPECIES: SMU1112c/YaeR family gloxylase I-like metalloprotein [Fusobacterium]|uniref:SMU1112c/YaeR family gloxylase I-like metalloprotein n=1 Tax=Fusobacterium TaxID=848 RepID=UPI0025C383E6|nr:VOC family protein [Fusobacterium sp.]MCI7222772.1 VOC family protein [Fusobacterium sp.]MDY5305532.1 VOC family protein [Fusobacterium gastrosuis]
MLLNKIHHIAIIGSDYEKSKEFYVDKLGFKVLRENYRTDKNDWKIDLILNNEIEIELFIIKNPPKRLSNPEANGLRHLAFKVENIEKIVNELNLKGIICEPIRIDPYTNKKMTFFKDPDDLPLELHE